MGKFIVALLLRVIQITKRYLSQMGDVARRPRKSSRMIYRIKPLHQHYLLLKFSKKFSFDSMRASTSGGKGIIADYRPHVFGDDWQEQEALFVDAYPEKKIEKIMPDIMYETGRLFMTEHTASMLTPLLEDGELLRVNYESGKRGYLFNPLKVIEVNTKLSTKDEHGDITSIVFDEEFPIFKTAFDNYHGVFCNQEFKSLVENQHLQGVFFDEDITHSFIEDGKSCKPTT